MAKLTSPSISITFLEKAASLIIFLIYLENYTEFAKTYNISYNIINIWKRGDV